MDVSPLDLVQQGSSRRSARRGSTSTEPRAASSTSSATTNSTPASARAPPSGQSLPPCPTELDTVDFNYQRNTLGHCNKCGTRVEFTCRGRLLVTIKTELLDSEMGGPSTVYKDKVRTSGRVRKATIYKNVLPHQFWGDWAEWSLSLSMISRTLQVETAPRREFICFATLFDASMINKDYKGKEVHFELSIGILPRKHFRPVDQIWSVFPRSNSIGWFSNLPDDGSFLGQNALLSLLASASKKHPLPLSRHVRKRVGLEGRALSARFLVVRRG